MLIVIKNNMEKQKDINGVFYLKTICDLKKIKADNYYILLFNISLDEYGIIKEYNYFLEEVLVTIPVNKIITNLELDKLNEICSFHGIPITHI